MPDVLGSASNSRWAAWSRLRPSKCIIERAESGPCAVIEAPEARLARQIHVNQIT
jgi:hypothetical protein